MKKLLITIALLFFFSGHSFACEGLDECLLAIEKTASPGDGITQKEQELDDKISAYGEKAVPGLLLYLKHHDKKVSDLASYILRGISGLKEEHLPALIEAYHAGEGWLPPAIARIGTDEAIQFLITELRREKEVENQLGFAITILGPRAVPYLVQHYDCKSDCDKQLLYATTKLLGRMGANASTAIPTLQKIAEDKSADPVARTYAEEALIELGSPSAANILIERLKKFPREYSIFDTFIFSDIASMGKDARGAGPYLVKFLDSDDNTLRIYAARALGFIGYDEGADRLAKMLRLDGEMYEVYVATESLGRLHAKSALKNLEEIRGNFWHPTVRTAANKAISMIKESVGADEIACSRFDRRSRFLEYENAGSEIKPCKKTSYELAKPDTKNKLYKRNSKNLLGKFIYKTTLAVYGENGKEEHTVERTPDVAIKLEDGWLIGSNYGEWGGELLFWRSKTEYYIIANENVRDIFITPYGIIAITGLAHLFTDYGRLLKIDKNADGLWKATIYKELPSASRSNYMLKDGRLLLHSNKGSFLFSPDTGLAMAKCSN